MLAIKTILHPTDFSWRSEDALKLACALARDYGARLILLHVKEMPSVQFGELGPNLPEPGNCMESLRATLRELPVDDLTIDETERRIEEGDPADVIVRVASETESDLIVMSTHGRRGVGRLVVGSVAEEVLRRAPCPVLTVRQPLAQSAVATREEATSEPEYNL